MACDLTLGRLIACKDNVGGIRNIYFINFDDAPYDDMTIVDEEITSFLPATPSAYKYELKGANNLEEVNEVSAENGTSFWAQSLAAILQKQDKVTQKELKLASYGNPKVIVEDYLGNQRLIGAQNGTTVQANTVTGAAMGDLNGYNLTITGEEQGPALYLSAAAIAELTIVTGV
jgi:hypothetical protein